MSAHPETPLAREGSISEEKGIGGGAQVLPVVGELSTEQIDKLDSVAAFLAEVATRPNAEELLAPWTKEEEKRLVRKIDWIVIPLNFLQQTLMAIDKSVMSTAALFTFKADLGLVGQDYSWANSVVFFGIIAGMFPQAWLCQRYHIGWVQGLNVIGWAVTGFGTAGAQNKAGLYTVRVLLGYFEGVGHTGVTIVLGMFYKKSEQPIRAAISYNIVSSIFMGLIGYALQFYTGPVATWRLVYIVFSAATLVVGVAVCFLIPASPHTAWWLTERQKVIAVRRVAENQTGVVNRHLKRDQVKEAFLDIKTWIILFIGILTNVPNGGLGGFYTLIVNQMGFTTKETTLLNMVNGVVAQAFLLFFSWMAGKTGRYVLFAECAIAMPFIGAIMLACLPRTSIAASLIGLYLLNGYWAPCIIMTSTLVMANVAGNTKKSVVFATVWLGYCIGNLVAPQTFLAKEAPRYQTAISVMVASFSACVVLIALYGLLCYWDNKKKAAARAEWEASNHDQVLDEWQDLTDKQNPIFVYKW